MPSGHVYTLRHLATVSTAITIMQIKTGAQAAELLGWGISQYGSTTSAQESIQLLRKTAAATVTTAVAGTHLFKRSTGDPTAGLSLGTSATGVIGTVEGTDGDIMEAEGFNVLNGFQRIYLPEERPVIAAGEIIALKFANAPASQSWRFWMRVREL